MHPEVPLQFGDMSRRWGGKFPPHKSHQNGRDVDVRPIRKDNQMAAVTIGQTAYDAKRTEEFVKLLRTMFPGITILFNDPKLVAKGWTKKAADTIIICTFVFRKFLSQIQDF